jgi:hypothetical protein
MPGGDEKQVAAATKRHAEAERKLSEEKIRAEGLARRSERARAEADRSLRCPATQRLVAHHTVPLYAGGDFDPVGGVTLCQEHHRQVDRHAR